MSQEETPDGQPVEDELQFSSVEPTTPAAAPQIAPPQCVVCHQPIADQYYAVGDKLVCPPCRENYDTALKGGSRLGRLSLATLCGIGAGLVGALIWFGIRKATGYDLAIVAIVVGLMVGGAVRAGSGRRGGRGYQVLALLLTYLAVGLSYAPDLVMAGYQQYKEKHSVATHQQAGSTASPVGATGAGKASPAGSAHDADEPNEPAAKKVTAGQALVALLVLIVLAILLVIAGPILIAFTSLIEALIIAFALWEAWKINARKRVAFAGPYSLEATMPPAPPTFGQVQ